MVLFAYKIKGAFSLKKTAYSDKDSGLAPLPNIVELHCNLSCFPTAFILCWSLLVNWPVLNALSPREENKHKQFAQDVKIRKVLLSSGR